MKAILVLFIVAGSFAAAIRIGIDLGIPVVLTLVAIRFVRRRPSH